jgi:D-lyxose ketol-isomerase
MTDDDIFDLADQYGWMDDFGRWNFKETGLIKFALVLLQAEREACAKVCDELADKDGFEGCYADACAEAIRARGDHGIR